jgi:hypothetical protein
MTVPDTRAIARVALFERYRADGATTWIEATGGSMGSLIPPGSRLLVEFGRAPERPGEVIVFRRDAAIVAHRLVARRGHRGRTERLIAKGDAEALPDRPIARDDVLGVVRAVGTPSGRLVSATLGGWSGAVVARVSWWSGRVGRVARRAATRAPRPIRPAAVRGALSLSRVPTRVVTAAMPRLDRGIPAGRR